jgi:RNA-directed DNA polymerase
MSEERRDRQSLNLITGTHAIHSDRSDGHKRYPVNEAGYWNRWIRISLKAQDRNTIFSNIHKHINADALKEAFNAIDGKKVLGVTVYSKAAYGKHLAENLKNLAEKIQRGTYRPQSKREVLIPKSKGKTRPIVIACFEDKLVDWVVGKILSTIYEPVFIRTSFGYRPNKSASDAINAIYRSLYQNRRQHIVEIDFSSFFNTIPHRKLMEIIGKKIADRRFKELIGRFLEGKLISSEGEVLPSELGTPQGSIMSPVLANIYLHEMLDEWFLRNHAKHGNVIIRYADDALFLFSIEEQAIKFLGELEERVKQYGLKLNADKSRHLTLSKSNHEHFHFLGFTFYWGIQGSRRILKIKTQKDKLIKSMQEFDAWIKKVRNQKDLKTIWSLAKSKIQGHINYFGYRLNIPKLHHFYHQAMVEQKKSKALIQLGRF